MKLHIKEDKIGLASSRHHHDHSISWTVARLRDVLKLIKKKKTTTYREKLGHYIYYMIRFFEIVGGEISPRSPR